MAHTHLPQQKETAFRKHHTPLRQCEGKSVHSGNGTSAISHNASKLNAPFLEERRNASALYGEQCIACGHRNRPCRLPHELTLALRSAFVREEVPVISALTIGSAFALAPFGLVDGLRAFRLLRGTSSMIAASKAETAGRHI